MHDLTLLQDLAVVLLVAGFTAVVCQRLRQPVLLGYLLAGLIIGPHTPPFPLVRDEASIRTLADLGVVFLLFGLGLEFSLTRLRRVGLSAGVAAALEMSAMIWLGYHAGRIAGFSVMDSLFLGAILSIGSSTFATALFREKGLFREPFAQVVFGVLIAEDVLIIFLLVLLSGIALTGELSPGEVLGAATRLTAFALVTLSVGLFLVPRLLGVVARSRRDELLLLSVIGVCFGLAILADRLGYSVALGAFVAGAVIAESREIARIERLVAPVRDLFGAVFFVAVGMLIDPAVLLENLRVVLGLLVLLLVGKTLAVAVGTFVTGLDLRTSLKAGMSLAQIGEFSFIIAQLGRTLGVTGPQLYPIAVGVAALAILVNPHLIDASDRLAAGFARVAPPAVVRALAVYTSRVRLLRTPARGTSLWPLLRRSVRIVAVNVVVVSLLFGGAALALRSLPREMRGGTWFRGDVSALAWLLAAILALPFLVATWRKAEAVMMILAEAALPRAAGGVPAPPVDQTRRLLLRTLLVLVSGAMGLWLLALSGPMIPPWPVFLALIAVVALLVRVLWTTMIRVYGRMQVRLEEILREAPPQPSQARAELVQLLEEKHPWSARVAEVLLPERSEAAGRTIGELGIRRATGASVVGIHRGGVHMVNPGPAVPLFPGDTLVLIGGEQELAAARALLLAERPEGTGPAGFDRVEIATVEVPPGSPLAGMRVAETPLRSEFGVTLVGLERGDRRMPAPQADMEIRAGDLVVLLGLPEAIERARTWVGGPAAAAGLPGAAATGRPAGDAPPAS